MLKAALGLVALVAGVFADQGKDLGSVLAGNQDLSKFYELIKACLCPMLAPDWEKGEPLLMLDM